MFVVFRVKEQRLAQWLGKHQSFQSKKKNVDCFQRTKRPQPPNPVTLLFQRLSTYQKNLSPNVTDKQELQAIVTIPGFPGDSSRSQNPTPIPMATITTGKKKRLDLREPLA